MKKISLFLALLAAVSLFAGEAGSRPKRSGDPMLMQLFSQLDDSAREKLQALRESDPVAYRQEIDRRLEVLRQEQARRHKKMQKLIDDYRANADDPRRQAELKAQLAAAIGAGFDRHLDASRRNLEHLKQRTAKLEQEIQTRAEHRDEIVSTFVNALLSGEKQLPNPRQNRGRK